MESNVKIVDKRDNRDPEQVGKALRQLRKLGMSTLQAADYIENEATVVHFDKQNGSVKHAN